MKRIINLVKKSFAAVLAASMIFTALPQTALLAYADDKIPAVAEEDVVEVQNVQDQIHNHDLCTGHRSTNGNTFTIDPNGGRFVASSISTNDAGYASYVARPDKPYTYENYWVYTCSKEQYSYHSKTGVHPESLNRFNDLSPVREGYSFMGWFRDGDKTKRWTVDDWKDETITIKALWAPVIIENNIKIETINGNNLHTSFSYNKDELKSFYDDETEVLLVRYQTWTKVPNDRNDKADENGYYMNWNTAAVDFNYNPFVFGWEPFKYPVEEDTDIWIRYNYVVIKKDVENNPNNWIYGDWSNVLRESSFSDDFKDTLISQDVYTSMIYNQITFNPNGGAFTEKTLKDNEDHIVKRDDKTGALSFYYWKDTYKDGTVKCGYSLQSSDDLSPVKDGYVFAGWYEKNEDGTINLNKKLTFSYLTEDQCVDKEYIARWIKPFPIIDDKNVVVETVDGKYIRTIFNYNKDELKSLYNEENEALLVLYENWTKVPNDINDEIDKNGNYVNWNAAPVDFNYNPFVFVRELYKNQVENDTDAWIRYKYVVIKKDTQNNPNNYILDRWSNKSNILREAKTWSKEFKVTLRNEKATAGGDIVEEDTRYDNIAAVTRKDLTKDNTEISEIKAQTYNGTYLKPTVSVKFKENADSKPVVLVEGVDYIKTYENNLNAGTAKVVIKGNGLYKGTVDKEFAIAPKSAKKLKATAGAVKVGDNASVLLDNNFISVFDGTEMLTKDVDYTLDVSTADLSKKGKTTVTVKGKNNYSDDEIKVPVVVIELKEGEELIRTASIKASVSANLIYKGTAYKFTPDQFEVSTGSRVLEAAEYAVSAKNVKDVGTGYVTIKAKNKQVKGSVVIPVEILPNTSLTLDITGKDDIKAVTYNGKLQRPKVKVTSINPATNKPVTLKLNKDYKLIYANNIHATNGQKTAEVKVVGIGNYENADAVSAFFEIKAAAISKAKATGTAGNISLTFNKHDIVNTVDYTLSAWTPDATGKKSSVTITGKGDFTGEVTKIFKVSVAN